MVGGGRWLVQARMSTLISGCVGLLQDLRARVDLKYMARAGGYLYTLGG